MINRVVLTGRITKELDPRKSQSGMSILQFTLAVDRGHKKEGQPSADFINCIAFNKTADLMTSYLHKGSLIGVDGRIQTRNYENREGQRVYVTEVIADSVTFLESRNQQPQPQRQSNSVYMNDVKSETSDIYSDDLPF